MMAARACRLTIAAVVLLSTLPAATVVGSHGGSVPRLTHEKTNEHCVVDAPGRHPSPVPCAIALSATLHGIACSEQSCSYSVDTTAIGTAALTGLLNVQTTLHTGGADVCFSTYPVSNVTDSFFPCGRTCSYSAVGTEVACPSSVVVVHEIPQGDCALLLLFAILSYDWSTAYVYVPMDFGVCHEPDGTVSFYPLS